MKPPVVLASAAYEYLARSICTETGFELGEVERRVFPDGEHYQRLLVEVDDRDVVLVAGTISDHDTLGLYDLACAAVKYGARTLTMVIPYFCYSTMERAVKPGEVVTAKTRARLLSAIPEASAGNRAVLLDLHSEGLPHYFEGGVRPVHLYAKQVILEAVRRLGGDRFVLACTDAGRAKWVESLANELEVDASFVFKRRLSGQETEVSAVSAHVDDKRVVIYDDMIRTGSSLLKAAAAYRQAGASSIAAAATHGLFPGDSLQRIEDSGELSGIVCTDSHPRALELAGGFLTVDTVAGLFADYLKETLCN